MLFARTNIEKKLAHQRNKTFHKVDIIEQVRHILDEDDLKDKRVYIALDASNGKDMLNHFDINLLDSEHIFHINDIKKICIEYRLRFLDASFFKNEIPYEAISKIKYLEKEHQTTMKGFKIIAPSSSFKLKNADDPLLFVPISNDYFCLIHKWGNDLHPLRKWLMLPFKNIENLALTTLLASFLITLMIPNGMFSMENSTSEFWLLFFFIFKSMAAIVIFYGFALGKNFNTVIWNSKYFNA